MAAQTLLTATICVGAFDISASSAEVNTSPKAVVVKEVPSFGGGGFMAKAVGVRDAGFSVAGWSDLSGITQQVTTQLLGTQQLVSAAVPGTTAGDPAEFMRGTLSALTTWGGKIGDASMFLIEATPDAASVTGQVAAPLAVRTTTGTGTAIAATGPSATQRVHAGLHIISASGTTPSLTVKIQSAPASNFASPTDRITLNAASGAGWQYAATSPAAVTDGWWRATWTISGTGPSFTFAVLFGIAP